MLITNARLLNEGQIIEADLLIKRGRIEKIAKAITAPAGTVVYDESWALKVASTRAVRKAGR